MFGKWFTDTYEGSMMGAGPIILSVWPWVMAHAGATGELTINPRLVAAHIGISVEEAEGAIAFLCKADPNSRSEDEDGRRLIRTAAMAYRVVNHEMWRARRNADERREYNRIKQQEARERKRHLVSNNVNDGSLTVNSVSPRQKTEGTRQSSETDQLASEPESGSHDIAHPPKASGAPDPSPGDESTRGEAATGLGASSQGSKAVSPSAPKPKRTPKPPSPQAIEIAQHLFDSIVAHSAHLYADDSDAAKAEMMLKWTVPIDRALKKKEITLEGARLTIDYAHHLDDPSASNGFTWHTNLLGGESLRKQWKKKKLLADATRWRSSGDSSTPGKRADRSTPRSFGAAHARVQAFMGDEK